MFEILKKDPRSSARVGRITTAHGAVQTPSYVVVATHGRVRTLEPHDIPGTKTQMVIANTYHLYRTLGDEGLKNFPGLHSVMGWQGPIMTDSGGFQVVSLGALRDASDARFLGMSEKGAANSRSLVRVTDAGVYFDSGDVGNKENELYLDAERSLWIQKQLGADIVVAFDEPSLPRADYAATKSAMTHTHSWALRALDAKTRGSCLYGVVQGGAHEALRKESAKLIGNLPFDGFAIGGTYGDAYGGTKAMTRSMLLWSLPYLRAEKPRHLFGVGTIEDILLGVEVGIDTFDCVIPTREARHGGIWTARGRYDILRGRYKGSSSPLEDGCTCPVCASLLSQGELHKLFKSHESEAGRNATINNVYFFNQFMEDIRRAIYKGSFLEFKATRLRELA